MRKRVNSEAVTPEQWTGTIIALIIIIVPIILVVAYPTSRVVHVVFGDGRILAFWASITIIVIVYRDAIDGYVAKFVSRYWRN